MINNTDVNNLDLEVLFCIVDFLPTTEVNERADKLVQICFNVLSEVSERIVPTSGEIVQINATNPEDNKENNKYEVIYLCLVQMVSFKFFLHLRITEHQ